MIRGFVRQGPVPFHLRRQSPLGPTPGPIESIV
jgi:hypothetical protein